MSAPCERCEHIHAVWIEDPNTQDGGFVCRCGCTFDPDEPPHVFDCTACGQRVFSAKSPRFCPRCGQAMQA